MGIGRILRRLVTPKSPSPGSDDTRVMTHTCGHRLACVVIEPTRSRESHLLLWSYGEKKAYESGRNPVRPANCPRCSAPLPRFVSSWSLDNGTFLDSNRSFTI